MLPDAIAFPGFFALLHETVSGARRFIVACELLL